MAGNLGVIAHAADDLRVEDIGPPAPAADEAIVEIAYGGICGSDLHYWRHGAAGQSILREPLLLGHEGAGTVVAPAADGSGPAAGTRVAVHPLTVRGDGATLWPAGRPNLAPASTYLGSAMHLPHTQGLFARRVALPSRMLHPLPEGLSLETAVLAEPAAVAWHGIERAGTVQGKHVAVIGCGPIGQLAASVSLHHGAASVSATDMHPLPLTIAQARGIQGVDARDTEAIDALQADVVVESSGTVAGLASAIAAARRGGIVVLLGLQRPADVPAAMSAVITRELELRGSFRFASEFDDVISAMADGSLAVDGIVTHARTVSDALAAFELAADASLSSKVLLAFGD